MLLTRNILQKYINISKISNDKIINALTSLGFEVAKSYELCSGTNLVLGYVEEKNQHPDADRLSVCKVNIGNQTNQIVCGAPNVKSGQKVIVALEGSQLPVGLKIKKTTIRGQESNGMICSLKELGYPENLIDDVNKKGIYVVENNDIKPGDINVLQNLGLLDTFFEIEMTPNRSDAWSFFAIAKELGIYFNITTNDFKLAPIKLKDNKFNVNENCGAFSTTKISNFSNIKTPNDIKLHLNLLGFKSQNILVDIANYVLLETGQPSHFFDANKISGEICVSKCWNTSVKALNNRDYHIDEDDLIVCDQEKPLAIAGIIGLLNSSINNKSTDAYLEIANFDSVSIRKTMRKHDLFTHSGLVFSKSISINKIKYALGRIIYLLQKYIPHIKIEKTTFFINKPPTNHKIKFDYNLVQKYLGFKIEKTEIQNILQKIGCEINDDIITPPEMRLDLKEDVDLVEEIARISGYNKIPSKINPSIPSRVKSDQTYTFIQKIKKILNLNSFETRTYALTTEDKFNDFSFSDYKPLKLQTFISQERTTMRHSVIPSLINVCEYNVGHQQSGVNIFEISNLYHKNGSELELGILHYGKLNDNQLYGQPITASFFTIKGVLANLFNKLGLQESRWNLKPLTENDFYNHFAACQIIVNKEVVGYMGEVSPFYQQKWKNSPIYVLQLNLKKLSQISFAQTKIKLWSKFPLVNKDFTFSVNKDFSYKTLLDLIYQLRSPLISDITLISIYQKENNLDEKFITIRVQISNPKETLNQKVLKELEEKISGLQKKIRNNQGV